MLEQRRTHRPRKRSARERADLNEDSVDALPVASQLNRNELRGPKRDVLVSVLF